MIIRPQQSTRILGTLGEQAGIERREGVQCLCKERQKIALSG